MYVCMCTGVTSKQINQALQDGAQSASDLLLSTGAGGCCGSCVPMINSMVEEFHGPAAVNVEAAQAGVAQVACMGMVATVDVVQISSELLDVPALNGGEVRAKIEHTRLAQNIALVDLPLAPASMRMTG